MKKIFEVLKGYFRKLDKVLFFFSILMGLFSVVILYAVVQGNASTIELTSRIYKVQLIAVIIGAVTTLIISAIDYHKIVKLWFLYMPLCILLVLLTFTDMGVLVESTGDKAWLNLGFGTIQPSELLKIAFICTFSLHLSSVEEDLNKPINVILLCLHGIAPVLLIFLQGDDGTAVVFFFIFVCMLFVAGISWKYILPVLIATPIAVWVLWTKVLKTHQKMRFLVLFDENLDPLGYGYQQYYGKIALGSGKLLGKGLFSDEFIAVPEAQNDFIFAFIGQSLGFVGCMAVLVALAIITIKIFANSRLAKDPLGKYLCVGMFSFMLIHCILNIGMVLGVMPVIGITLPYLSQGGTSVVALFVGIGLVMSTYSHSEKKYHMFYTES